MMASITCISYVVGIAIVVVLADFNVAAIIIVILELQSKLMAGCKRNWEMVIP